MATRNITIAACQAWLVDPHINPLTKRRIAIYGTVYERLKRSCAEYGLVPQHNMPCEATWIELSKDDAALYDKSAIVRCKICPNAYSRLYFIHARKEADTTDYTCCRCDGLAYFCLKCKNLEEE